MRVYGCLSGVMHCDRSPDGAKRNPGLRVRQGLSQCRVETGSRITLRSIRATVQPSPTSASNRIQVNVRSSVMEIGATVLAFYGVGAAAAVASLAALRRRLQLSRAKHPSLTGHARMARRVA